MAHNATHISAAFNCGITVAVDDTGIVLKMSHDTTGIGRTTDATTVHTAVVNAGLATGSRHNRTGMTVFVAATDAGALNNHILDDCVFSVCDEGCGYVKAIVYITLNSTFERSILGADRLIYRKRIGQHIVATHSIDIRGFVYDLRHRSKRKRLSVGP